MDESEFAEARAAMVAEVVAEAALTAGYTGRVRLAPEVLAALGTVPRHEFVPVELAPYAYLDRPLPIGEGKTISQPYIVALMTDLLNPGENDVVLEVGAGTGYQAAVLAQLVDRVYAVERIAALADSARERLRRLGYANVEVHTGNGYFGWAEHAPYDKVIITAACEPAPAPIIAQLKPRGRMVVPTGNADRQSLTLITKDAAGVLSVRELLPVRFSMLDGPGTAGGPV